MHKEYDAVFIGAGHNAMICAGYLAKAGLKVLVVDRHLELGGGLDSHEGPKGGFWHNMHSCLHRNVPNLPWYRDLELAELGQEYILLPIGTAMLLRNHKAIVWHTAEIEKTAASIARISKKDAKTFLELNRKYKAMAEDIFFYEIYSPPVPFEKKKALLEQSKAGREYLEWQPYSCNDFLKEVFENDIIRGVFTFNSVIRGYEVDSKGTGMLMAAMIGSGMMTYVPKGTTHKMAHTLHKMIAKAGIDVVESQSVDRILMQNGQAVGVHTVDGREFRARQVVVSSVNPHQTFLDMIGKEYLQAGFAGKVEKFRYSNTTPLFTLHLALNERLYWKAAQYDPDVDRSYYILAGLEGLRDVEELYEDCAARRLPRSLQLLGSCSAQHDPSQAPPGKCTAYLWQVAPGNLCEEEGGPERWDDIREEFTQRCVDHLAYYSTNLTRENIVYQFGQTPLDIERHLPNMRGGDIQCGEMAGDQILDKRPLPECSQYRTPVPKLYMCGASMHFSGNITGSPGYNAARVICEDLGIKLWWKPIDAVSHWEALAKAEKKRN
ncbi:MAG: NAD(P)/FAD-dependent oxidoreductase [Acidobacteria bacterium]|nr:NAD(P)/FAD-dependent oxidoreductase [Acidobacteriota bacterium]